MRTYPLLLCLLVAGCSSSIVAEHFTFRDRQAVEAPLKLAGYYYHPRSWHHPTGSFFTGEAIDAVLLWEDGTAAYVGGFGFTRSDDEVGPVQYGTEREAHLDFERYLLDPERFEPDRDSGVRWGAFRVEGDALRMQLFQQRRFGVIPPEYEVGEYRGTVLDDTTLVLKQFVWLSDGERLGVPDTFHFRPLKEKPPSSNWTHDHPELE